MNVTTAAMNVIAKSALKKGVSAEINVIARTASAGRAAAAVNPAAMTDRIAQAGAAAAIARGMNGLHGQKQGWWKSKRCAGSSRATKLSI